MIEIGGNPIIHTGGGYGYGYDGMGFGGGNSIWAFLLFALLNRGGFGCGDNGAVGVERSVYNSQNFNQLDNGIRAVQNGICDSVYAVNNAVKDGFYSTGMNLQGINQNLGNALCTTTYELNNQIRNVGDKVTSCCCTMERAIDGVERAIDGVNFNGERNTNAVIQAVDRNGDKILAWLNDDRRAKQDKEINSLNQEIQTQRIIAAQKPVAPVPAYLQPNPYAPYQGNYGYGYGYGCCN